MQSSFKTNPSRDPFWLCLFSGYFLLQVILRVATGGSLGLDEAEIILDARQLELGYGPQLPLYAWLQWAVFQVTGSNIFGLALLKNALLLATVAMLYATLRTRYNPVTAGMASLSLLLLYQFSWEAQRALTHTVLVNFCSVLSLMVIWWVVRKPAVIGFVVLGLVIGLGGLSKYNFSIAVVAMLLAVLSHPETRRPFLSPWLALSAGLAALVLYAPMRWVWDNQNVAMGSAGKLEFADEGFRIMNALQGIGELAVATLGFLAVLIVVAGYLYAVHRRGTDDAASTDLMRFLARILLWSFVILIVFVVISGSTNIKERWLQPILIYTGPLVILWLLPRIDATGIRRLAQFSAIVVVSIVVILVSYNLFGTAKRAAPFVELTRQVFEKVPDGTPIVAPVWVAGNMFVLAPDSPILSTRQPTPEIPYFRIWQGKPRAPKSVEVDEILQISAPYRFDPNTQMTINMGEVVR